MPGPCPAPPHRACPESGRRNAAITLFMGIQRLHLSWGRGLRVATGFSQQKLST
jgi:hypothetical protein